MNADGKTSIKDGENNIFRCYAASQENQYPNVYKARKYNLDVIPVVKPFDHQGEFVIKDKAYTGSGVIYNSKFLNNLKAPD